MNINTLSVPDLLSMLVQVVKDHADPSYRGPGQPFTQREIKAEIERRFADLGGGLQLHHWDTDIGHVMALATDANQARSLAMQEISDDDAARPELSQAISGAPVIVTKPKALIAWHNG